MRFIHQNVFIFGQQFIQVILLDFLVENVPNACNLTKRKSLDGCGKSEICFKEET